MNNQERELLEEAYYHKMNQLNQADELITHYQTLMTQKTSQLVDYVHQFYRDIPDDKPINLEQPFEEVFDSFQNDLKLKRQEIDELRNQEQRQFNLKIDE